MGLFKKSSAGSWGTGDYAPGEPQPHRYKLLSVQEQSGYTVVMAKYTDCSEYGGVKILVYEGSFAVKAGDLLDPHFLEHSLSPIARFAPTEAGYAALARLLGIPYLL
jgi:hypothetical protein